MSFAEGSVHGSSHVLVSEPELRAPADVRGGGVLEPTFPIGHALRQPVGDERAMSASPLDQPRVLEGSVGLRDGVRGEVEVLGKGPDRRQARTRGQ